MQIPTHYHVIFDKFGAQRIGENHWRARCPAHDDQKPSLSFWVGRNGALVFGCWAGCQKSEILRLAGVRMEQMFSDYQEHHARTRNTKKIEQPREVVAKYVYKDESSYPIFRKLRYEPKSFSLQRYQRCSNCYCAGISGCRNILYHLEEYSQPKHSQRYVIITEGEKDCDLIRLLGFIATTNYEGGGKDAGLKWKKEYSESLKNRKIAIFPDEDEAGIMRVNYIVGSLAQVGVESFCVISMPSRNGRKIHDAGDLVESLLLEGGEVFARKAIENMVLSAKHYRS